MRFITQNNKTSKIYENLKRYRFLSDVSFEFLPEDIGKQLCDEAIHLCVRKNELLYKENDYTKGLFILLHGKIKIFQTDRDGAVSILFIYSKGDVFGFQSMMGMNTQHASASALEDCEYLFIPEPILKKHVATSVELSNLLLKSLSAEFSVLLNRFGMFTQQPIKERVALSLLLLNEKYQQTYQLTNEAEIKISRSDLAAFVGTSLENLVRTLKTFKEDGLIRTDGKSIYITNFDELYSLTGLN